jgi:hypothetical protein
VPRTGLAPLLTATKRFPDLDVAAGWVKAVLADMSGLYADRPRWTPAARQMAETWLESELNAPQGWHWTAEESPERLGTVIIALARDGQPVRDITFRDGFTLRRPRDLVITRCSDCQSLVLAEDQERHARWHAAL